MQSNTVVSILMPVYNGEKYLREAIDSVLAQTYTNFEFIIINDGSTDQTQKIIDSYHDERIKCIKQDNQGVAKALNNGIKVAKGAYIWRHDADDICLPDQLEKQIYFLKNHPEYSLVATQIAFMSDRGKIAYKYRQPNNLYFGNRPFKTVTFEQFNPYSPITHATVLMDAQILKQLGAYRTEFLTSEDTDLWLRWIEKNKAAVLNYCSYFVRLNSTSATKKYQSTTSFYRDKAFDYYRERKETGTDPIMRGEIVPLPPTVENNTPKGIKGKIYRNDLLDFHYKVMLNAGDWNNVWQCIRLSLKDGWKLKQTWKGILFPLIGERLIQLGVSIKSSFK
jgi:glycosyltransferase involved in cell wall biosynthesis